MTMCCGWRTAFRLRLERLLRRNPNSRGMIWCVVSTGLLTIILMSSGFRSYAERGSWNMAHLLDPPLQNAHVAIVNLNPNDARISEDYLQADRRRLKRSVCADLLRRLKDEHAAVVAFDMSFDGVSENPKEDDALKEAIGGFGPENIFLAAPKATQSATGAFVSPTNSQAHLVFSDTFKKLGSHLCSVTLALDPDGVIRQLPLNPSDLARSAANRYLRKRGDPMNPPERDWLRYYDPDRKPPPFVVANLWQVVSTNLSSHQSLSNKLVFVGLSTQWSRAGERPDSYMNPFWIWSTSKSLTSGNEVHATIAENLIRGDSIGLLPPILQLGLALLFAIPAAIVFFAFRRLALVTLAIVFMLIVAGFGVALERICHVGWAWSVPAFVTIPYAAIWAAGATWTMTSFPCAFISYRSKGDGPLIAAAVHYGLRALGIDTWLDNHEELRPGVNILTTVTEQVACTRFFVVILTKEYIDRLLDPASPTDPEILRAEAKYGWAKPTGRLIIVRCCDAKEADRLPVAYRVNLEKAVDYSAPRFKETLQQISSVIRPPGWFRRLFNSAASPKPDAQAHESYGATRHALENRIEKADPPSEKS